MTMNPDWLLNHFEQISEAPDAVPRLRRFILDLAVRGELVEQNPKDEPAKDLLKNSEQAIAIKHTKELFDFVPQGWIAMKFGQMLSLKKGKKPRLLNAENKGLPYLDIAALERNELSQFTEDMTCPQATADDLIIVCDGSRSGLVLEGREGVLGSTVAAIQFTGFSRGYLRVLLKSLYVNLNTAKKGAAIPHLNIPRFLALSTVLPPLAEQHRIVAKVDELMVLCDEFEAAQAKGERRRDRLVAATLHGLNNGGDNSEQGDRPIFEESARFYFNHLPYLTTRPEHIHQLRQTILNLAVRGKLVPRIVSEGTAESVIEEINSAHKKLLAEGKIGRYSPLSPVNGDEVLFAIPSEWRWMRLGDITFCRDGERIPVSREERQHRQGPFDYYGASGVIDKIDAFLFDKPLLLIGEDGANLINRSTPIAFIARGQFWVNNHAHVLDGISEGFLRYIELFINATDLKPYVTGTAQPKMNQAKMNSIPVALPPLTEQNRIVTKVDELMSLCDELETKLTTTVTTRRQLLEATLHEALKQRSFHEVSYEN